MAKTTLYQFDGGQDEIELAEHWQEKSVNTDLLHRAVRSYMTNQRQGTRRVKTRGQVVGSSRKPWPQKHTGRARHGDRRSPLWVGGGKTFAPQPKEFRLTLPKKMRQAALGSAVRDRVQSDRFLVIDELGFEAPRTKGGIALLEQLGLEIERDKVLVLVAEAENTVPVHKSFSNIPRVRSMPAMSAHPYEILNHEWLLVTSTALDELERRAR